MRLLGTIPADTMRSSAVHFWPGDVLYGRLRPYLNKVYRPEFEGLCSAEFIVFPRSTHLDSRYLQYLLNSSVFVSFASHLNTGDRPRVDFEQLRSYPVDLAPLSEQHRIADEIEKQLTRLDAAVAALERARANLKRYRASVLWAACEGRLVRTEAELARAEGREYEPADQLLERILKERRARWEGDQLAKRQTAGKALKDDHWKAGYQEPAAPATEPLPPLPEGWAWSTVEQLAYRVQYGTSAKAGADPGGVPVLRMGNILNGSLVLDDVKFLPLGHVEFPELLLATGDILFNRTNSPELVGKTAVYRGVPSPCSFASYLIRVRLTNCCGPEFLACYINSVHGREWIRTVVSQQVGQANVNGSKLKALAVPTPPAAEQRRIVAEVDRRLSLVDELEAGIEHSLKRADRLRQSILKRAFAGKLVAQDPNDEPASVLLERIRAERSSGTQAQNDRPRSRGRRGQGVRQGGVAARPPVDRETGGRP